MVCAKCEEKERKLGSSLAVTDVWKAVGKGSGERNDASSSRSAGVGGGGNKLLQQKRKMKMMPYVVPDTKAKTSKKSEDKGEGSSSFAGGAVSQCKDCKQKVARVGAKYCASCAYKSGVCSQCGVEILKNKAQYKMSSK